MGIALCIVVGARFRTWVWLAFAVVLSCSPFAVAAPTDAPKPVSPDQTVTVGRYQVRMFTVAPKQHIATQRGGKIKFLEFHEDRVVVERTFRGVWPVGGEINIGNHETLEFTAVDLERNTATVRLRSKQSLYVWEGFSF